ncbi:hypothetical protein ASPVEDRAFT_79829 [Aspergillus versicolor CBS 583.65]|uniref:WSC domain-containing protein n=1 Tax=Aspergillus versicolor CBS 583.65 TaxID=1036611 RepID=A0A1L9P9J4_ASPVE|nr:uncharacterized protein ASPVEDRAFT_79829 [Aspergillus versicolor CBS 583.65]OJI98168.1 hypothetical protein ASPVEDRAFT_79829 [Aspergillus versicolor CBS 583.65]
MVWSGFRLRSVSRWAALLLLAQLSSGLRTTPGSPCESSCSPSNDTLGSEIVCLDHEYSTTAKGRKFKDCVGCQLESTFFDDVSKQSDVEWGLYNLRYAFSSCVYGIPEKVANISNPCPVACEEVEGPATYDLDNPTGENLESWCNTATFADNEITACEVCYNLTSDSGSQMYIANFLESIRYNCHFQTPTEVEFPITPDRIFAETMLPSSTADLISSGMSKERLAIVIAMPILGFVIFLCLLALGCFFFIRSRRKKVRRLRQPNHLHARWNDTGISTPQWATEYPAQAQGAYGPAVYSPKPYGSGYGFDFVDNDGRSQNVGYSKVVEPVITSPSTVYSPEEKVPQTQQTYFPPPPSMSGSGKMKQPEY